jgi:hypothetical protein
MHLPLPCLFSTPPYAGCEASPLFSLAAAHPEAFTALIDCFLRSPVLQAEDMLAAGQLLVPAAVAVLGSQHIPLEALDNIAAVASLASAIASFAKRAVQLTRAAITLQGQPAAAAAQGGAAAAAAFFPAAVSWMMGVLVVPFLESLSTASPHPGSATGAAGATRCSQAAASTALLCVVAARGLVQLADAMEAAGPQLLFRSLMASRSFRESWDLANGGDMFISRIAGLRGSPAMHTVSRQWFVWQAHMLQAALQLVLAVTGTDAAQEAAAAAAAPAGAPPPAGPARLAGPSAGSGGVSAGSSSSSSSSRGRNNSTPIDHTSPATSTSSSRQQVSWGYLLQLQQCSPRWAAAVSAFDTKWPGWCNDVKGFASVGAASSSEAMALTQQRYTDAVELCRVLAAAMPLPLLCNNLGCESLARVSEAAAACKRCAGCRCHYCSAACQTADWKRHQHACRRMRAAGKTCV